jgi:hypothetical protein
MVPGPDRHQMGAFVELQFGRAVPRADFENGPLSTDDALRWECLGPATVVRRWPDFDTPGRRRTGERRVTLESGVSGGLLVDCCLLEFAPANEWRPT